MKHKVTQRPTTCTRERSPWILCRFFMNAKANEVRFKFEQISNKMKALPQERRYLNRRETKNGLEHAWLQRKKKEKNDNKREKRKKTFERLITTCKLCKLRPCKYFMRTIRGAINYWPPLLFLFFFFHFHFFFFFFFTFLLHWHSIQFPIRYFGCLISQQRGLVTPQEVTHEGPQGRWRGDRDEIGTKWQQRPLVF